MNRHLPPFGRSRSLGNHPSALDEVGTTYELSANTVLYAKGDPAESLYYLDVGAIKIEARGPDGEQILIAVHGPGGYFGARSLSKEAHNTTATALLKSVIVSLPKGVANDLLHTDPIFARHFGQEMMRQAAALEEDQIDRAINSTKKRLARLLLILGGIDAANAGEWVLGCITEIELAMMLAADPACIRKLLQEFRRAGHLGPAEAPTVHSSLVNVLLSAETATPFESVDSLVLLR